MTSTRREQQREATTEEIKAVARQQMAQLGTSGLSIRGIAKEMGITPPALYRYFDNLDALVTALILENFNALADALENARDAVMAQGGSVADQMLAALLAYRQYAVKNPVDFQLIYGNPIPGYEAPGDLTVPASSRTLRVYTELCFQLLDSGQLNPPPRYQHIPDAIQPALREALRFGQAPDEYMLALYFTMIGWPRMHGIVMLELFDHIPPVVGNVDVFYRNEMINLMHDLGYEGELS